LSFEESCEPIFAAHQTFHPRFGWLKKGVDAIRENPSAFNDDLATSNLGVGKNMVEAIKFWCLAFKLIEVRDGIFRTTDFADAFLGHGGLDPYLEDVSTLWLLHYRLISEKSLAPVWWLFFNKFSHITFDQRRLSDFVQNEIQTSTLPRMPNRSSVEKDVDALLRMYALKSAKARQTIEDVLDSPFRDLGLVLPVAGPNSTFRLIYGKKPTLNGFVVTHSCLSFLEKQGVSSSTVSLSRLLLDENSPGLVFKIGSEAMRDYLTSFPLEGLSLVNSAGSYQLVVSKPVAELMSIARSRHYLEAQ